MTDSICSGSREAGVVAELIMPGPDGPDASPVRRVRFSTSNVDEATEMLRSRYADHVPMFSEQREHFAFDITTTSVASPMGTVTVDRLRHSMWVDAAVEPFSSPTVVVPSRGYVKYTAGRDVAVGGPMLAPGWARSRCEWDDIEIAVGSVDRDGLQRVAAELSDIDPATVALTGIRPLSPGRASYLVGVLNHLERTVVGNAEAMASVLARSDTFRQLATAVLVTFPNTALAAREKPIRHGFAEPAVLRRALGYIDEHAGEDIGVDDIANAARVSVRGLQLLFRRHRDCTPTHYLRGVRLERAHAELQAADPTRGAKVAVIAARWGFVHPGRFSVDYRNRFGRTPRETLRE